jgi:hypothetical protein
MKHNFFKKLYGVFAIAVTSITFAQSPQLQSWSIPVNSVNFTSGSPVSSLLPSSSSAGGYYNPSGSENEVSIASNSMHDSNGNLLFFVTQDAYDNGYLKVFDKNANLVGNGILKYDYNYTVYVGSGVGVPTPSITLGYKFNSWAKEISIIPVPGNCNQYYIIAGFQDEHNLSGAIAYQPVYAKIDLSIGTNGQVIPVTSSSNLKGLGSLLGVPAGAFQPYAPNHKHRFGIAATPYRPESTNKNYFLYIYSAYNSTAATGFFKYQINATGISFLALESPIPTYTASTTNNFYSEMELVKLPTGNYRMAKVIENNNIYCCDLNYATGSIISGTGKTINLPSTKSIEGLEFSPNGNNLYYTYHGTVNKVAVLQNISAAVPVQIDLLSGIYGFIEMAFDGKMYFSAGDHLVSKIGPDMLPGGSWNLSAVTLNPAYSTGYSYSLPDQLDGNVYYKTNPTISGNVTPCLSSTQVYTLSGAYDPTVTYNWTTSGGTPSSYSGTSQTLAITWTGSVGTISVQVGCSKPTTLTVNTIPNVLNPDFTLSGTTIVGNATDYRITATPVMTPPGFWWEISEVDVTTGSVIAGTTLTNNQTWWYAPFIASNAFPGYDYSSTTAPLATGYSTSAPYATPPYTSTSFPVLNPGKFKLGRKYRITRGVWGTCTPWTSISKTIYINSGLVKRSSDPFIVEDDSYSPSMPSNLGAFTDVEKNKSGLSALENINVYPNPNNGSFVLVTPNESAKDVLIYDVTGSLVYSEKNVHDRTLQINMSDFANGFYYLKVISNGVNYSQKIIKE